MGTLGVLLAGAALLLAATGLAKLRHPEPAGAALSAAVFPLILRVADGLPAPVARRLRARLPLGAGTGRALGAVELAVAVGALASGGRIAAAVLAAVFTGFAVFTGLALRPGRAMVSCGCAGTADTPPTVSLLLLDVLLAGAGVAAAVLPPGALLGNLDAASRVVGVGVALLVAWLGWLTVTALPKLSPAARGGA